MIFLTYTTDEAGRLVTWLTASSTWSKERNVEIKLPSCALIPADGPAEGWIPTNTTFKIELGIAGYLYIVFISFRTRERPGISENEEMLIDCTAQTMVYYLRMDRTQRLQIFAKTVKLMLFQAPFTKPNLAPRPITWKLYLVTLELGGTLCQPSNSGNNKIVPSKYLSGNMYMYTYQGVRSKANASIVQPTAKTTYRPNHRQNGSSFFAAFASTHGIAIENEENFTPQSDLEAQCPEKEVFGIARQCLYYMVDLRIYKANDTSRKSWGEKGRRLTQKIYSLLTKLANIPFLGGLKTGQFGRESTGLMN